MQILIILQSLLGLPNILPPIKALTYFTAGVKEECDHLIPDPGAIPYTPLFSFPSPQAGSTSFTQAVAERMRITTSVWRIEDKVDMGRFCAVSGFCLRGIGLYDGQGVLGEWGFTEIPPLYHVLSSLLWSTLLSYRRTVSCGPAQSCEAYRLVCILYPLGLRVSAGCGKGVLPICWFVHMIPPLQLLTLE